MIRIRKNVATVLSTLLVLGTCGVASAQSSGQQPSKAQPSGQTHKQTMSQEQFDREKVTLKDQVQESINAADQQIDALKSMSKNDKGTDKKRDDDYQKQLSTIRDHLKADLSKIDKAKINDWSGVRPVVDRDIGSMDTQLQKVAMVTNVPLPTGVTNRQPPSGTTNKQPPEQQPPSQPQNPNTPNEGNQRP